VWNLKISIAGSSDIPKIARVHVDVWKSTYKGIVSDNYLQQLSYEKSAKRLMGIYEKNESIILMAEDGDNVIGFLNGGKERKNDPVYKGEVYAVYILEQYQNKGVGRELIKFFTKYLLENGINNMIIWAFTENKYRCFYEKLGGKALRNDSYTIDGKLLGETGYCWDDISSIRF